MLTEIAVTRLKLYSPALITQSPQNHQQVNDDGI